MFRYIEFIVVGIILILQFRSFFKTRKEIRVFQESIPESDKLSIDPQSIQNGVITFTEECSSIFQQIVNSINEYLKKNRSGVSDFNLIRDIVDREVYSLEEGVYYRVSTPLYLGLMGTMVGIIVGLMDMSSQSDALTGKIANEALGSGISSLLWGVMIAMIASLTGLVLTTVNSSFFLPRAKQRIEKKKNILFSLIQTELLPVVNQTLSSSIEALHRNLTKFNGEFSANLGKLSGIFTQNYDALKIQESILEDLQNLDVAALAKYNVKVFKEIKSSAAEFEKFNIYFSNLGAFLDTSAKLVTVSNELLGRTNKFETIADTVQLRLTESAALLAFLGRHFQNLESYKTSTEQSIARAGHDISDLMNDLKTHLGSSTELVRDFTIQEVDLLKKTLTEGRTSLAELQSMGEIVQMLSDIREGITSLTSPIERQGTNQTIENTFPASHFGGETQMIAAASETTNGATPIMSRDKIEDTLAPLNASFSKQNERMMDLLVQLRENAMQSKKILSLLEKQDNGTMFGFIRSMFRR